MTYRPSNRKPRGAWARHLHAWRQAEDLSQTQAHVLLHAGLSISPSSRATYIKFDMGDRQPDEAQAEYLASVVGWPTEEDEAEDEALDAGEGATLAEAISDLAAQVKVLAERQMTSTEMAAAIGEAVRLAVREALLAGTPGGLVPRP